MRNGLILDTRLEAIAGPPAAVRTTSGVTTLTPPDAFTGRTLYVVFQVLALGSANATIAMLGTPPAAGGTAGFILAHAGIGAPNSYARFDTLSGGVNQGTPGPNGFRTIGKHVAAIGISTGMSTGVVQIDGSADVTRAVTPGSGMPDASLRLPTATANDAPIAAYAWLAPHDRTTRGRILRWLQARYATTPF